MEVSNMKNIIIVTNESNIVDTTLKPLFNNPSFVKVENGEYTSGDPYARWIEVINDEEKEVCAFPVESNEYNVLRVPLAGFAYMVAYARKHNRVDDECMVVCMKELYPTMVFSKEKYHLFLYGKSNINEIVFKEWFNTSQGTNALLGSDYDEFIDLIQNGSIPLLSEGIYDIL
jgi:hypothetical protein